jgi:deoxyribodipyrimidine photo-lyase
LDEHFKFTNEEIMSVEKFDVRATANHSGGETAAEDFFNAWLGSEEMLNYRQGEGNSVKTHENKSASSHLGPWLAIGAISLRRIYNEVDRFEREARPHGTAPYEYKRQLLWGEFCKYFFLNYGNACFSSYGVLCHPAVSRVGWNNNLEFV